jgi:poly(hydroxyalkanoate) depolymerase family esterase
MDNSLRNRMLEATRLTKAGRLMEATSLLLHGGEASPGTANPPAERGGPIIEGRAEPAEPANALGRDEPRHDKRHAKHPPGGPAGSPAGTRASFETAKPAVAELLRGVFAKAGLDRVQQLPAGGFSGRAPAEAVPEGAQFLAATFSSAAGSRPYKLYVPSGYRGRAVPLVVMLHGCTQSADDFAAGTRMNALAEEKTFLVAYPEQIAAANASKCWNWFNADDQQRDRGEPSLIAGITRQVMHDYCVDPRRVYIAGLSAGGAAAAVMGAAYPDLYAAIGVHSGLAHGAASDMLSGLAAMRQGVGGNGTTPAVTGGQRQRTMPAIVFHGDRDTTVHPSNGNAVIAQAMPGTPLSERVQEGRAPGGHAYTVTLHTDPRGETMLEHWLVRGAGHAWSGGSPAGSFTDPRGPDASREILRFFLEHPRPFGP